MISYFFCSTGPVMFVVYALYEIILCARGKSNLGMVKAKMRKLKEGETEERQGETEEEKSTEEKEKMLLKMKESII